MSKTCQKCNSQFATCVRIDGKKRNLRNRGQCLDCQPFMSSRYCLKTEEERKASQRAKGRRWYAREKTRLGRDPILVRREQRKSYIVNLIGGGCQHCGYSKCSRNLTFHHLRDKEFGIASREFQFAMVKVISEIKKCVLVCHNCHGEIHDDLISSENVQRYHLELIDRLSGLDGEWPAVDDK